LETKEVTINHPQLPRRLTNHFSSFIAEEIISRIAAPIFARQCVSIGVDEIDSAYCAESSPLVNNTRANFLK
jgi:hypothetical protein